MGPAVRSLTDACCDDLIGRCDKTIFVTTEESDLFETYVVRANRIEGRDMIYLKTMFV